VGDRLSNKVAVITGTGGAIGRALALAFAREGARVVGCDLHVENARQTLDFVRAEKGEMVSFEPCDLSDESQCERLMDFALAEYGRVDVLVNNAGVPTHGRITDVSSDFWYKTIQNELHLVYLTCKAAWPALSESRGTIVNMASAAGWLTFKALAGLAHSAAKGGVIAMTRHLAMEGRHAGIRVNSISPGPIETPKSLSLSKDPEWADAMTSKILRGTLGKPHEVAAVGVFLASDESSFIDAADIRVDGGVSAW
jgi:NAD(P)-dependent dehydrogenase (short-subunit alcohol dehydrogenase family)